MQPSAKVHFNINPKSRSRLCLLAIAPTLLALTTPAHAIITSGTNGFNGFDVNAYLGAYAFYNQGYGGRNATVANIEGGFTWNGHESLSPRGIGLLYFSDPSVNATTPAYYDLHATATGQIIGGYGNFTHQYGIALVTNLWSGAIASSFVDPGNGGYGGSFNTTAASFANPYYQAAIGGVNNTTLFGNLLNFGTADIISSSWGGGSSGNGNTYESVTIDAIAKQSGKLIVFAAGNEGSAANTIGSPADGMNAFVVGSLGNATGAGTNVPFDRPSDFSSRSPTDLFIPADPDGNTGVNIPGARARVDIAAPGESLTLAAYGEKTGGNSFAATGNTFSGNNFYFTNMSGTSFATPIVSGGAALVVDVARDKFATNPAAVDGRVIKAVLMNSAAKTLGWTNNAVLVGGVSITSQGLDQAVGTGRIDLAQAYTQFTTGTTDVPGLGGGSVLALGWDYGEVGSTFNDYLITPMLLGTSTFSATLTWYANATFNPTTLDTQYGSFFNLDLELFKVDALSGNLTLVGESASLYNSSEHLYFSLLDTGNYVLRVHNLGALWNFTNDTTIPYGLAWSATVIPESTSLTCLFPALLLLKRRR